MNSQERLDFPFFKQEKLIYLDSAATSQKPQSVIDSLVNYYSYNNANIHRGVYALAQKTTDQFEMVRNQVAHFINAKKSEEIVFTKGATQSLNWVVFGYFARFLKPGDEILISVMEHHSNLVPWQELAKKTGAELRYVKLDQNEQLDLDDLLTKLNSRVKVVSIAQVSNVLGCINPVKKIASLAHKFGALVVVDGAQAVGHMTVDVGELDCDFYCFSGHKMFGPTGIGVLYGKYKLLDQLKPVEYGGEMIDEVDYQASTFKELPLRLEAGTQNIAGVIGLGAAIDYLNQIGLKRISKHNQEITELAFDKLRKIPGLKIYGSANPKEHHDVISFNLAGIHPHDAATVLDSFGVEVRAGHHCAEVLMRYLKIPACLRASFHLYNDESDVLQLVSAIKEVQRFFKHGTV
ncbi:aminotransferase class V-fold PLP-dependent enzyme [Xylocopilactobacillus apicola]|uniref:Cysteine desulfurase n=1 Tax=Xylocopilactobacillus apicola TaxID=2932184 RepID=A0AAU9CWC4_9LACO|nr:cysteine desulfurase [Xylocopilactobacillus apicola]BDR58282.1 cysteine desulfurase [Xylocopilactobacillus apicola]